VAASAAATRTRLKKAIGANFLSIKNTSILQKRRECEQGVNIVNRTPLPQEKRMKTFAFIAAAADCMVE
jgi:hypothetical protein